MSLYASRNTRCSSRTYETLPLVVPALDKTANFPSRTAKSATASGTALSRASAALSRAGRGSSMAMTAQESRWTSMACEESLRGQRRALCRHPPRQHAQSVRSTMELSDFVFRLSRMIMSYSTFTAGRTTLHALAGRLKCVIRATCAIHSGDVASAAVGERESCSQEVFAFLRCQSKDGDLVPLDV